MRALTRPNATSTNSRVCRHCRATVSGSAADPGQNDRCPFCLMPWSGQIPANPRSKTSQRRAAKAKARSQRNNGHPDTAEDQGYEDSHAGHPLGRGMPMGQPLRADGETHREAWKRALRADPCSYCDSPTSGTIDHIVPQSRGGPSLHTWLNYTAACEACNCSKSSETLLLWLARRPIIGVLRTPCSDTGRASPAAHRSASQGSRPLADAA